MSGRATVARYAAPAALLAAVTVAVLLIRAGLGGGGSPATALGRVSHATTRTVTARTRTATVPRTAPRVTYTVQSGDTFGSIAAREGVPVAQLERLNPGVSSNSLQVGQRLRIK